jgi:hypothetical protein
MKSSSQFRAGELVEVRSREEILASLDKNGRLDGLPFMPEMLAWSGRRLRVFKRAHKTCDPPNGIDGRSMPSTVHLEDARCGGSAHGGCQARCLLFWKDAWLKKVDEPLGSQQTPQKTVETPSHSISGCTEADVLAGARKRDESDTSEDPTFVCQATQVGEATQLLRWWNLRQYVEDYTSGNVRLSEMIGSFCYFAYTQLIAGRFGLGAALRWLYDAFQKLTGGTQYPVRIGRIPQGEKTPNLKLGLQPGELVRIRSYQEILDTLDETNHNRGMWFDAEMVPHCGKTFRVLDRVNTIVNEKTGKLIHIKNDCIMLDEAVCLACYAKYRLFCPRSIYAYWREIWLERVMPDSKLTGKSSE